jgi:hypothetical protein
MKTIGPELISPPAPPRADFDPNLLRREPTADMICERCGQEFCARLAARIKRRGFHPVPIVRRIYRCRCLNFRLCSCTRKTRLRQAIHPHGASDPTSNNGLGPHIKITRGTSHLKGAVSESLINRSGKRRARKLQNSLTEV